MTIADAEGMMTWETALADWQRRGTNLAFVHALPVVASALLWTLVHECSGWVLGYFLNSKLDLPVAQSYKWRSRVVSFFFSVSILMGAFYCLLVDPELKGDAYSSYSLLAYYTITTTVGFFLWDVIICMRYYEEFRFPLLFHGVACLITFVSFLVRLMFTFYLYLNAHALM
jgi:hypothetical protein